MAEERRVGELNPDGSIKHDVRVSVLSGKVVEPGDPMIGIPNTPYFYRLEAQEFRLLNDEKEPDVTEERRVALNKAIQEGLKPTVVSRTDASVSSPIVTTSTPNQPPSRQSAKDADKGVSNG